MGKEERREEEREAFTGRGPGGGKEKAGFRHVLEGAGTTVPTVGLGFCGGVRGLWQEPGGRGLKCVSPPTWG